MHDWIQHSGLCAVGVFNFSWVRGPHIHPCRLVTPVVRTASPVSAHGGQQGKRSDTRRNLYVLGVPFGMTKYANFAHILYLFFSDSSLFLFIPSLYTVYPSPIPARSVSDQKVLCSQSLAAVFSPHGTVSHCVILATLDSASRRRGFVVMSTHEQARQAMAALGRNSKGAGGMDISWAVVQRSKGLCIVFFYAADAYRGIQVSWMEETALALSTRPPLLSPLLPLYLRLRLPVMTLKVYQDLVWRQRARSCSLTCPRCCLDLRTI